MPEKGLKLLLKSGNLSAKSMRFSISVKIHVFFDRRVYIRKLTAFGYSKMRGVFEYEGGVKVGSGNKRENKKSG